MLTPLLPGRCLSWEATLKFNNAFEHIKNDALKFCSGLFFLAQQQLPEGSRQTRFQLQLQVARALANENAQKICQTALDQQVTPEVADEELLGIKLGVEELKPGNKTRAFQVLNGASQTNHSWQHLLKRVCADECQRLLNEITAAKREISTAGTKLKATAKGETVPELCAKEVVQKAEAEVLTCCGQECGWNNRTCRLWPFFDASEKLDWNARCCAEGTILKDSSRERLCNSVQPKAKRQQLRKMDARNSTPQDAGMVGQDLVARRPKKSRKRRTRSLLQSESRQDLNSGGTIQCNMPGAKCGELDQRRLFLQHCKERQEENWQFLTKEAHDELLRKQGVKFVSDKDDKPKETSIRACYAKLQGGVDSVSWLDKVCYFVEKRSPEIEEIYAERQSEVTGDIVSGGALFKLNEQKLP